MKDEIFRKLERGGNGRPVARQGNGEEEHLTLNNFFQRMVGLGFARAGQVYEEISDEEIYGDGRVSPQEEARQYAARQAEQSEAVSQGEGNWREEATYERYEDYMAEEDRRLAEIRDYAASVAAVNENKKKKVDPVWGDEG